MPNTQRERIEKPWGYEVIWAETDSYVGKTIVIWKDCRLSTQYHLVKEENIFVVEGHLTLELQGAIDVLLGPSMTYHIPPGLVHRFCANRGTGVRLIEISTPHLDDVVRLEDDYGRV